MFGDSLLTANKYLGAIRKKTPTINKSKASSTFAKKLPVVSFAKKAPVEKHLLTTVKKYQAKQLPGVPAKKTIATQKPEVKTDTVKIGQNEDLPSLEKVPDTIRSVNNVEGVVKTTSKFNEAELKKLSVFIDCNTGCDMNYIRTDLTIVDFLLDMKAADVHVLVNEQKTGSGGSSIQMIFYGQHKYKSNPDTLIVNIAPNSTEFERREEMLKGIKRGLIPFLLKTGYAKYIDVKHKYAGNKPG